jgi:hypothetical protein
LLPRGHAAPYHPGCHGSRAWAHHHPLLAWSCWGRAVVLSSSAQRRRFVGVGVLLGIGHTIVLLIEMVLVFLKLKQKKNHKWDREVTSPSPVGGHLVGHLCRRFRHRCRLDPDLVVAVVPVVAVPREPLVSSQFPFPSVRIVCLEILISRVKKVEKESLPERLRRQPF